MLIYAHSVLFTQLKLLVAHLGSGATASRVLKVYRGVTVVSNSPLKVRDCAVLSCAHCSVPGHPDRHCCVLHAG
jgi:hypothetical protein